MYVVGMRPKDGDFWFIYRPGEKLVGDRGAVLGYENRFLGTARVERFADVSTVKIESAKEEIIIGDRLLPAPRETLSELRAPRAVEGHRRPHPEARPRGRRDGPRLRRHARRRLGTGARSRQRARDLSRDRADSTSVEHHRRGHAAVFRPDDRLLGAQKYLQVPDERTGLLLVFRVFESVSYALVVNSTEAIRVGDYWRTP